MDSELEALESSGEKLRRRIEARDGLVRRISAQVNEEQAKFEKALKSLQEKQVQDNDALSKLAKEVEALQVTRRKDILFQNNNEAFLPGSGGRPYQGSGV